MFGKPVLVIILVLWVRQLVWAQWVVVCAHIVESLHVVSMKIDVEMESGGLRGIPVDLLGNAMVLRAHGGQVMSMAKEGWCGGRE